MERIDKIREFFKNDIFAMDMGAKIESVDNGNAVCSFEINERHLNAGGVIQGGALFTICDFAFAVASNSMGKLTVSVNNNISFLEKSEGTKIFAEAKLIKATKKMVFYEVEAKDDLGKLIATMQVTGFRKDIELDF